MGSIGPNFRPPGQPAAPPANPANRTGETPSPTNGVTASMGQASEGALKPMSLSSLFAAGAQLNAAQTAAFLRNLLQLPREMVELLALLANVEGESTQQLLKALLSDDIQIPLETLQQLLQNQGVQAKDKLLKLLGTPSSGYTQGSQQLGDLLQALSQLSNEPRDAARQPGMQSLHTAISLYLPFFPLHPPQQFSFRQDYSDEEANGESEPDTALTILLTTLSLGRIKAVITQEGIQPVVWVEHALPDAASAQALERAIQSGIQKECHREAQIYLSEKTPAIADEPERPQEPVGPTQAGQPVRQEARLLPAPSISATVVLTAYALIRAVFELDNSLRS